MLIYLGAVLSILSDLFGYQNSEMVLKTIKGEELTAEEKGIRHFVGILDICYVFWIVYILGTTSWYLGLCIFIMSLIPKKSIFIIKLDALVSLLLIVLIVLNEAHFKISLF